MRAAKKEQMLFNHLCDEVSDITFKDRLESATAFKEASSSVYATPIRGYLADRQWRLFVQCLEAHKLGRNFERAHEQAVQAFFSPARAMIVGTYIIRHEPTSTKTADFELDKTITRHVPESQWHYTPFKYAYRFVSRMPEMWSLQLPLHELSDSDIACLARTWMTFDRYVSAILPAYESYSTLSGCLIDMLQSPQVPLPTCLRTLPYPLVQPNTYQQRDPSNSDRRSIVVQRFENDVHLVCLIGGIIVMRCTQPEKVITLEGLHIHLDKTVYLDQQAYSQRARIVQICTSTMFNVPCVHLDRHEIQRSTMLRTNWIERNLDSYPNTMHKGMHGFVVWSYGIDVPRAVADHLRIRACTKRCIVDTTSLLMPLATLALDFAWRKIDKAQMEMAASHGLSDSEPSVVFDLS